MDNLRKLNDLKSRLLLVETKLDYLGKTKTLKELEVSTQEPNFWQENQSARKVMKSISKIENELTTFDYIKKQIGDLEQLIKEQDQKLGQEVASELKKTEKILSELEVKMFLSKPHDESYAILSIHAGQGGVEAMDWVQMLSRMYQKFFAKEKWKFEVIDLSLIHI